MTVIDKLPDIELPNIELPDVTKLDLPKVDVEGAKKNMAKATSKAASSMRGGVADRMPQRSGPSPLPFVLGGLLAGMTIGYFIATSSWFAPRVKTAMDQLRGRIDQMRSGSGDTEDLGELGDTTSRPYGSMDLPDTVGEGDRAAETQESYAV